MFQLKYKGSDFTVIAFVRRNVILVIDDEFNSICSWCEDENFDWINKCYLHSWKISKYGVDQLSGVQNEHIADTISEMALNYTMECHEEFFFFFVILSELSLEWLKQQMFFLLIYCFRNQIQINQIRWN